MDVDDESQEVDVEKGKVEAGSPVEKRDGEARAERNPNEDVDEEKASEVPLGKGPKTKQSSF